MIHTSFIFDTALSLKKKLHGYFTEGTIWCDYTSLKSRQIITVITAGLTVAKPNEIFSQAKDCNGGFQRLEFPSMMNDYFLSLPDEDNALKWYDNDI